MSPCRALRIQQTLLDFRRRTSRLPAILFNSDASRLGLDVYIRLPEDTPTSRLATIARPNPIDMLLGLTPEAMNPRSKVVRTLRGSALPHDERRVYARGFEVPSGGAVGTARAIAHAYGVFAAGGRELGLRKETLDLLAAPAVPPTRGFRDECLKAAVQFSLGFMKPSPVWPFGNAASFGFSWSRRFSSGLHEELIPSWPARRTRLSMPVPDAT